MEQAQLPLSVIRKKWLLAEKESDLTTTHFRSICNCSLDELIEVVKERGPILNEGIVPPVVFSQYLIPLNQDLVFFMDKYAQHHEISSARLVREVGTIVDDENCIERRIKYYGIIESVNDSGTRKIQLSVRHEDFTRLWHLSRGKRLTRNYAYLGFPQSPFLSYNEEMGLKIVLFLHPKERLLTAQASIRAVDSTYLPDFGKDVTNDHKYKDAAFFQ